MIYLFLEDFVFHVFRGESTSNLFEIIQGSHIEYTFISEHFYVFADDPELIFDAQRHTYLAGDANIRHEWPKSVVNINELI